jgi:CubicO group peptidase (beta-lactamase class C family)
MNDSARWQKVQLLLEQGIATNIYSCCVVAVGDSKSVWHTASAGLADPEQGTPADSSTLFDLASLTKPVACASSVMALVEEGVLQLEASVSSLIGEAPAWFQRIRLRHLLTHTSGLPAWKPFYEHAQGDGLVQAVLQTPPSRLPEVGYEYSDLNYILLGEIIRRTSGKSLADYSRERIFLPVGMPDTLYNPGEHLLPRVAVTANCPWRKGQTLRGQVHDANAWAMGGVSGHAGLFSTANDLARFCQMLLRGGEGVLGKDDHRADIPQSDTGHRWTELRLVHPPQRTASPRQFASRKLYRALGLHRHSNPAESATRFFRGVAEQPCILRLRGRTLAALSSADTKCR